MSAKANIKSTGSRKRPHPRSSKEVAKPTSVHHPEIEIPSAYPGELHHPSRTGVESLSQVERLILAGMVMELPLAEVQQQAAGPRCDGGFDVRLTGEEVEQFYLEVQKAAVQSSLRNLGEVNRIAVEEEAYRRIGTPVLCLLQQRLHKLLGMARPKPDEIKAYFSMLLDSRKMDLAEKKALDVAKRPQSRTEEEKMEMVWDMFALPEEERVRRRGLWKEYKNKPSAEQTETVADLAKEDQP